MFSGRTHIFRGSLSREEEDEMLKQKIAAIEGSLTLLCCLWLMSAALLPAQAYSTPLPTVNDKDVVLLSKNLQAEAKQLITRICSLPTVGPLPLGRYMISTLPKSAR
jgi:hypothetical protein